VPWGRHRDLDLGVGRLADEATSDQVFRGSDSGAPAHLLVDSDLAAGTVRRRNDRLGVQQFLGQWLLAEQVLAGSQGSLGDLALMPRRHCDIHDLDAFVGQQRVK
jgi:hypothetical protein